MSILTDTEEADDVFEQNLLDSAESNGTVESDFELIQSSEISKNINEENQKIFMPLKLSLNLCGSGVQSIASVCSFIYFI